ncbi:MAG: peptidylprolyl isomerase [Waddliaceae bacterium]|nr:peptidylprolyl isomerase [Waddliaceae bacterium]
MTKVKEDSLVKVHYTLRLSDGQQAFSSYDDEALEFSIGDGRVLASFEQELIGMEKGEKKKFVVDAENGYGQRHQDLVITFEKEDLPLEIEFKPGLQIQFPDPDGEYLPGIVRAVTEETVSIDMNHPLAGEVLHFEVELVDVH